MSDTKQEINTNKLSEDYNLFIESNNNLDDAYRAMRKIKNSLPEGWSGKSADKYISKFDVISDRFDERVKPAKEDYADYLKNVIEGYEEAENTNVRMSNHFKDSNAALLKFIE